MGGTLYNSRSSRSREAEYRSMSREDIFRQRAISQKLNPFGIKVREARDSEAHPNTVPIIIAFDVTGSMGRIPEELIKNHFSKMMEVLISNHVPDAAICFCAVGDHYSDQAPLQVGQFESGDLELNGDLTSIWIEGGGGGQSMESYMLPWLFAARHTSTDAFEKRKQKGFLFTIGDEWNHPRVESKALKDILGYKEVSEDAMSEQLLKEAREKWEVYHIHCSDGSYGAEVSDRWKDLLGEHCIVADSSKIVDIISSTVAIAQGASAEQVKQSLDKLDSNDTPQFIK